MAICRRSLSVHRMALGGHTWVASPFVAQKGLGIKGYKQQCIPGICSVTFSRDL